MVGVWENLAVSAAPPAEQCVRVNWQKLSSTGCTSPALAPLPACRGVDGFILLALAAARHENPLTGGSALRHWRLHHSA